MGATSYEGTDELEEWAFQNAKSGYIPFGVWGSSRYAAIDIKHYHQLQAEMSERITLEQEKKKQKKEEIRRLRAIAYAEQRKRQKAVTKEREAIIESMKNMSPLQKITIIAEDTKYPPYFYPKEFAVISDSQVASLSKKTIELLKKKFRYPPKAPWKSLMKRIALNPA